MKNRIGIVGGGQLGRMLTLAAKRLGFTVVIIDPTPQSPAGQVADAQIVADFKDEKAIVELASKSDYLTFEIELVNSVILEKLSSRGVVINPSAKTLTIIKDKLLQKTFLRQSGLPIADFKEIKSKEDILKSAKKFGYPIVIKARFDAYDGRGNALIKSKQDIDLGLKKLKDRQLYIEKFVPFTKELAVMVARNTKGDVMPYPVVETIHKNNICHMVFAPAPIDEKIKKRAQLLAVKQWSF